MKARAEVENPRDKRVKEQNNQQAKYKNVLWLGFSQYILGLYNYCITNNSNNISIIIDNGLQNQIKAVIDSWRSRVNIHPGSICLDISEL